MRAGTTNPRKAEGVTEVYSVYRVVVAYLIASLLWKSSFYPAIYHIYTTYHLKHDFFPTFLTNTFVLAAMLLVPVALGLIAMFVRSKSFIIMHAVITAICMFGLCLHQGSYNDVTFLTCFWVSIWCVWYSVKLGSPAKELITKAKVFAILIVSLIFLGAAVGKWTPEYWSGQVLYEIYFVDRDFWVFNWLRANLEPMALREFATYYSRVVVIAESACAFLWLLPPKIGGAIGLIMLVSIALFSNTHLFSVMFCLIGLTIVSLHESRAGVETEKVVTA